MKIYIGAKFSNADFVKNVSEFLEENGIINQYNWALNIKENESKEDLINSAILEKQAINDADAIIFLLPLGRGGHIELGMSMALNKPIYLCSNNKKDFDNNVNFYELDGIEKIVGSEKEIMNE